MASRRRAREYALQALYEADLRGSSVADALNNLWSGALEGDDDDLRAPEEEEVAFTERLVSGVDGNRGAIDTLLEECSTNWRVARMPVVDRNILRLASYELVHCADIPLNVSINEALELAKRFSSAESRAFVNGILDRVCKTVRHTPKPIEG